MVSFIVFMLIASSLILGTLFLIVSIGGFIEAEFGLAFITALFSLILLSWPWFFLSNWNNPDKTIISDKVVYQYKVKELENNTVFILTDNNAGYKLKDTVWVNLSKKTINPADSTAMMCVIVEQLKTN